RSGAGELPGPLVHHVRGSAADHGAVDAGFVQLQGAASAVLCPAADDGMVEPRIVSARDGPKPERAPPDFRTRPGLSRRLDRTRAAASEPASQTPRGVEYVPR